MSAEHTRTTPEKGCMNPTKMAEKQRFLARTASEYPDHRFTNLYDLLHWDYWMHTAAERVLARQGSQTNGVDGKTRIAFKADYEHQMTGRLPAAGPRPGRRARLAPPLPGPAQPAAPAPLLAGLAVAAGFGHRGDRPPRVRRAPGLHLQPQGRGTEGRPVGGGGGGDADPQ